MPLLPTITSVQPLRAVEGGRVTIHGSGFPVDKLLTIPVGDAQVRVVFASSRRVVIAIPGGLEARQAPIRIPGAPGGTAYISIGAPWATGLHQVDSPAFDAQGNLLVSYSGSRGHERRLDLPRDADWDSRAVRLGNRQRHVDGYRPGWNAVRVEPVRRRRVPGR